MCHSELPVYWWFSSVLTGIDASSPLQHRLKVRLSELLAEQFLGLQEIQTETKTNSFAAVIKSGRYSAT